MLALSLGRLAAMARTVRDRACGTWYMSFDRFLVLIAVMFRALALSTMSFSSLVLSYEPPCNSWYVHCAAVAYGMILAIICVAAAVAIKSPLPK